MDVKGLVLGMTGRKQERKKIYKGNVVIVYIVVLLLFGVIAIGSKSLQNKDDAYRLREEELRASINEQLAIKEEYKAYDEYTHTKKYIEDVARNKLGLVYPDEIIFKAIE